jgi:hypothetical protein
MQNLGLIGALLVGAFGISPAHSPATVQDASMPWTFLHFMRAPPRGTSARANGVAAAGAEENKPPAGQNSPAKCQEAVVSPVTGHADCVRPRGAAVDPPPQSAVLCSKDVSGAEKRGCPSKHPQ